MEPKIWISEIEFSDNTKIQFNKNDIIVFVGPNNSGKSATIKEAAAMLHTNNKRGKVIASIKFSKDGTEDELLKFLEKRSIKRFGGSDLPWYKGLGFDIYQAHAVNSWQNVSGGIADLAKFLTKSITTEDRLKAANPAENIKLNKDPAVHPINFLQKQDSLEITFSEYFKQAFGLDLIVHRNAGSEVPLYVGKKPPIKTGQDRLSEDYQNEIEKLDLLHEQGDGMRSFVGVLLHAFVNYYSVIFIDEPEAFLHPPQARLLGKMLGKDLPTNRQLFTATHSTDFLQGLLESKNPNLKIIRIERKGAINKVAVLNNTEINSIWGDSLLRHSNILDGLFHTKVIICESDSDNRFYSAILSAIHEKSNTLSPDTLFINCGGKHRIPTVIKALKQLNVAIRVIVDFDILNEINPLKSIIEETNGKWNEIEKDWGIVKNAIESKKPELNKKELKDGIDAILASVDGEIFPREKIPQVQKLLKKASAWSYAKEVGKAFIPSGDAIKAFDRMQIKLKENGVFIVEVGELESFSKSVGNHGPKWVNEVLLKDLINDIELTEARNFISELST